MKHKPNNSIRLVSNNNNKLYPAYQPGEDLMLQPTFDHLKTERRKKWNTSLTSCGTSAGCSCSSA